MRHGKPARESSRRFAARKGSLCDIRHQHLPAQNTPRRRRREQLSLSMVVDLSRTANVIVMPIAVRPI